MPKILRQMIRRKINVVVKIIFKYNMLFILMSGNYIYNSIFINKKIINQNERTTKNGTYQSNRRRFRRHACRSVERILLL